MLVEVCANSLQSALNAQEAGADRIELCSELGVGGITPSYGLIQLVKERLSIPIHVLIRPRSGHFTYTKSELEVMLRDIDFCKEIGVDGIVSGILEPNHTINFKATQRLINRASAMHFTFHRAFDWIPEADIDFKILEDLNINTILTSGHNLTAENGLERLKKWQEQTTITLMAGSGVNAQNALRFKKAGLTAIHLSGTCFQNELVITGKIPMNSTKHLSEHHVAVTNGDIIRQTIHAIANS